MAFQIIPIHLGGKMHCESKVPCLRTQHNVSGQGSRRMARCGDEHNNHEATAPPTQKNIEVRK